MPDPAPEAVKVIEAMPEKVIADLRDEIGTLRQRVERQESGSNSFLQALEEIGKRVPMRGSARNFFEDCLEQARADLLLDSPKPEAPKPDGGKL